jgi:hypothetical protein
MLPESDGAAVRAAEQEFDDRCARATAWGSVPPSARRDAEGAGAIVTNSWFEVQYLPAVLLTFGISMTVMFSATQGWSYHFCNVTMRPMLGQVGSATG